MRLIGTTFKNFSRHQGTDLAAGLTYYAVLAIFPALLALFSLLGVVGEATSTLHTVLDVLRPLLSAKALHDIEPTLRGLTGASGAPITLAIGTAGALYSASGYVGGFARAMNRIYEVEETRPFWKLRPWIFFITLVAVVLNAAALVIAVATGPIATSLGRKLGVGDNVLHIWSIAKWPAFALVVVIVVALLFHATPNIKHGRLRLLTPGAFLALLLWAGASTGFAFYVANFGSYNKTYGSIAGVIVGLLWLWLTNVALLLGAELDAARDARRAERKSVRADVVAAMVAESGPLDLEAAAEALETPPEPPETEEPPAITSSRRRDKVRVSEMFPRKGNEPPYGPIAQPVPDED